MFMMRPAGGATEGRGNAEEQWLGGVKRVASDVIGNKNIEQFVRVDGMDSYDGE